MRVEIAFAFEKIKRDIGWAPEIPLRQSLED
jgi:hypothetical protein